jgi:2-dehydropantoate 2-reductase
MGDRSDPMKIGVVGAGGLGGCLAAALHQAGHAVRVVDRGAHADAIRKVGLRILGLDQPLDVRLTVVDSVADLAGDDVVFVTVKAYALPDVVGGIRRVAETGTVIVPLLNGVEALDFFVEAGVPEPQLIGGAAYLTAFKTGPGSVERRGRHARLVVGELDGASTPRLSRLVSAFDATGIAVETTPDIRLELWRKMVLTCALAAGCGITRSPLGPVREHPLGRSLLERAAAEVVAVGQALGIGLTASDSARVLALMDTFPAGFYPSLLHDLNAGRPTEIDIWCGAIVRFGRRTGVPTPTHDAATAAVQLWSLST